jgi:hypothetical protein
LVEVCDEIRKCPAVVKESLTFDLPLAGGEIGALGKFDILRAFMVF